MCVYGKYSVHRPSGPGCLGLDTVYLPHCTSLPQALQEKESFPIERQHCILATGYSEINI